MDNFFYVKEEDKYFVLIYLLGSGSYANVWFSIYFNNHNQNLKKNKFEIKCCALKIHNIGDDDEAEKDILINEKLILDNKKSEYINYPLFNFEYEDRKIIGYEIAYCSLYDFLKLNNNKLPQDFINRIYFDMKKSIEFIHKCNYIHCDVRPENFLLFSTNSKQNYYYNLFINYNFPEKFKKIKNFDKIINNFYDEILDNNNSDIDSDINSDNNSENSYEDTDCESYSSYPDQYNKFEKIFIINKKNKDKEDKDKEEKEEKETEIKKIIENPIIKITDFGLMQHFDEKKKTVQTRYYRAPENILGLDYNYKIDYWSLGCSYYEILTGKILFDIENDELCKIYDKDLVHLRQIIDKLDCEEYIISLINKSPRKYYLLNNKKNDLVFIKKTYKKIDLSSLFDFIYQ